MKQLSCVTGLKGFKANRQVLQLLLLMSAMDTSNALSLSSLDASGYVSFSWFTAAVFAALCVLSGACFCVGVQIDMLKYEWNRRFIHKTLVKILKRYRGDEQGESEDDDEDSGYPEETNEERLARFRDCDQGEVSDPEFWATVHYGPASPTEVDNQGLVGNRDPPAHADFDEVTLQRMRDTNASLSRIEAYLQDQLDAAMDAGDQVGADELDERIHEVRAMRYNIQG